MQSTNPKGGTNNFKTKDAMQCMGNVRLQIRAKNCVNLQQKIALRQNNVNQYWGVVGVGLGPPFGKNS